MNRLELDLFCRPRIEATIWRLVVVALAFPIRFNVIAQDLDIFIDRSIIEIFVNSKVCLVQRVYPTRHDSTQFRLFSEDGRVKASKLVKWEMDATNPW